MGRFRVNPRFNRDFGIWIAACALTLIELLAPFRIQGQCQPAGLTPAKPSQSYTASSGTPQFYDEPQFTVAGVADATNLGGHGSDTVVRTKEALAKDTVLLSKQTTGDLSAVSAEAAEKSLREAVGRDPGSFDANRRLGKLLADQGMARDALPYLEKAAQLNPGNYDNAYELAMAYASAGKYEDARASLRALLARQDKAELHHSLGDVEEKLNHPLEAVRDYQRAAEMEPSELHLFDWGTELLAHRAPDAAIEVFARGNRLFPRSVRMLVGLGVAWHARGSYDQAAECLSQASDLNPNDPTPYLFLGKMQNSGTMPFPGLVEKLARFARIHPDSALANYYYAAALWKRSQGAPDPATVTQVQSLLQQAVHLDRKLGLAYLQLGIVYADLEDLPRAISAFQQAIEASPQLEEPHYRLAQAYRRTGEKAKAQQQLQLYQQLQKKTAEEAERERREIPQFVVELRDAKPASGQQEKP
jgi:tetratricopeptide (TPR) repeat protein